MPQRDTLNAKARMLMGTVHIAHVAATPTHNTCGDSAARKLCRRRATVRDGRGGAIHDGRQPRVRAADRAAGCRSSDTAREYHLRSMTLRLAPAPMA